MKNKFLYFLISLLGFATACNKDKEIHSIAMYGTPRADICVKGKVTDAAGNPIPGIEVSDTDFTEKKVLTGADGTFDFSNKSFGLTSELRFTDIDGPENGGEFQSKSQKLTFTEADRTAKGNGWYKGSFEKKNVDIKLTEKE